MKYFLISFFTTFAFFNSNGQSSEKLKYQFEGQVFENSFLFSNEEQEFEICGLDNSSSYYFTFIDDRIEADCNYLVTYQNVTNISDFSFTSKRKCEKFKIKRQNCSSFRNMFYFNISKSDLNARESKVKAEVNSNIDYLIRELLMSGSCVDIIPGSVVHTGAPSSIGSFTNGGVLGVENGVVMANADVQFVNGENTTSFAGGQLNRPGDADLTALTGNPTFDATIIEFDFIPTGDVIEFKYVFGSEEYCDWSNSKFNDAFAFFLSGPGISGPYSNQAINIAKVPNPVDPTGNTFLNIPVTINNINYTTNSQFYLSNVPSNQAQAGTGCTSAEKNAAPIAPNDCQLDAWTHVMKAKSHVTPCETYHIKLAVADVFDGRLGSSVFFKANSFGNEQNIDVDIVFDKTGSNFIYEDCGDDVLKGNIVFTNSGLDILEAQTLPFTKSGNADQNDYTIEAIDNIFLPSLAPGESFQVGIDVFKDDIVEGTETVNLHIELPCECEEQDFSFSIIDVDPIIVVLETVEIGCAGDDFEVWAEASGGIPAVSAADIPEIYYYEWTLPNGVVMSNDTLKFKYPEAGITEKIKLRVFDDCGNEKIEEFLVSSFDAPSVDIVGGGRLCSDLDSVEVKFVCEGEGPWTIEYTFDGVDQTPITTTNPSYSFQATQAGTYSIISVQDENCIVDNVNIAELEVEETISQYIDTVTQNLCYGDGIGQIRLINPIPEDTLEILWSDGSDGDRISDLAPGNYSVTIVNIDKCLDVREYVIIEPDSLEVVLYGKSLGNCDEPDAGEIDLAIEGGTLPYNNLWSNGDTIEDLTGLEPGLYTVTVTDNNGCSSEDSYSVTTDTVPPIIEIEPTTNLSCEVPLMMIDASKSSFGSKYTIVWTTSDGNIVKGDSSLTPTIDEVGTYQLQIKDNLNKCITIKDVVITGEFDQPDISGDLNQGLSCIVESLDLFIESNTTDQYKYKWYNSLNEFISEDSILNIEEAGTYTLMATNPDNGCQTSLDFVITDDNTVDVVDQIFLEEINCANPSITLDATSMGINPASSIKWETSIGNFTTATSGLSVDIDAKGKYTLILTNAVSGCESRLVWDVSESFEDPVAVAGDNNFINCFAPSVNLSGVGSSTGVEFAYQWTTSDGNIVSGNQTLSPSVNAEGHYTLVVTNTYNGCTIEDEVFIENLKDYPISDAGLAPTITCKDTVFLIGSDNTSSGFNFDYEWATPDGSILGAIDKRKIDINATGSYQLIVTNNISGCKDTSSVVINNDLTVPSVSAGPTNEINCGAPNYTLDGSITSSGNTFSYEWTTVGGNIIADPLTLTPTVNAAAPYYLTVLDDVTGCEAVDTVVITQDFTLPTVQVDGPIVWDCITTNSVLDGTGTETTNMDYLWTTNDGNINSGETTLFPDIDQVGTYLLEVTNISTACKSYQSVEVSLTTEIPVSNAGEPMILDCSNSIVNLGSDNLYKGANFSYSWSTVDGNIDGVSNEQYCNADSAGTYELIVTDIDNSCTASSEVIVTMDTLKPTADLFVPSEINCTDENATIKPDVSTGSSIEYSWTSSNGKFESGTHYDSVVVNMQGDYELKVTNIENGCTASETYTVLENTVEPTVEAGPNVVLDCNLNSYTIGSNTTSQGASFSYSWATKSGNFTGPINDIMADVDEPGIYELTVTDSSNGCTSSDKVEIDRDTKDPIADAGKPEMLNCEVDKIELDGFGSSQGVGFNYQWSTNDGNILLNPNTISPTIDGEGTYYVTVTNTVNNCTSIDSVKIGKDIEVPISNAGLDKEINCDRDQFVLGDALSSTGAEFIYAWSSFDGNFMGSQNEKFSEIDAPGTYYLQLKDKDNGCLANDTVVVTIDTILPIIDFGPLDTISCTYPQITLGANTTSTGAEFEYLWETNDGHFMSYVNQFSVDIDRGGEYTFHVINNSNSCSKIDTIDVEELLTNPISNPGFTKILDCEETVVRLDGENSSVGPQFKYLWTTTDGNIISDESTTNPMVDEAGTYTLTVYDTISGCAASMSIPIIQDTIKPIANAGLAGIINCNFEELLIGDNQTSKGNSMVYDWSTLDGNIISAEDSLFASVNTGGTYSISVTDIVNNCVSTSDVIIDEDKQTPNATVAEPNGLNCITSNVLLDGTGTDTGANVTYEWTTDNGNIVSGNDQISCNVDEGGDYVYFIKNTTNGCDTTIDVTVIKDIELPIAEAGVNNELTCAKEEIIIIPTVSQGSNFEYSWTTTDGNIKFGENFSNVLIDQVGHYIIEVTNTDNGCVSVDTTLVDWNLTPPDFNLVAPNSITCKDKIVPVTAVVNSPFYEYEWDVANGGNIVSGSNTLSPLIDAIGDYHLVVTNMETGCTEEQIVTVSLDTITPNANAGQDEFLYCNKPQVKLVGSGDQGPNFIYKWTAIEGEIASVDNTNSILVKKTGLYNMRVTNISNGCRTEDNATVEQYDNIPARINTDAVAPLCHGEYGYAIVDSITGGDGPYEFSFDGDLWFKNTMITNLDEGEHELFVKDANGCVLKQTVEIPTIDAVYGVIPTNIQIDYGEEYNLEVVTNIPTEEIESIVWTPAVGLSCSDCLTPTASPEVNSEYEVVITSVNGCSSLAKVVFKLEYGEDPLIAPNVFHPGDYNGINDNFYLLSKDGLVQIINRLTIYDRWGGELFRNEFFSPNKPEFGWDGTYKGKFVNSGVYIYEAEAVLVDGTIIAIKGDVTVIRDKQ